MTESVIHKVKIAQNIRKFLDFLSQRNHLFISVYFDKKAQDHVAVVKKLQKSTCIMRGFALIYKRIDSYMSIGKIRRTEGAGYHVKQWYL